jgi:hypothetical protein
MEGSRSDSCGQSEWERVRQERDVQVAHRLTTAEYALAQEGAQIGRALAEAGLGFDAHTFVAIRILESTVEEGLDLAHALRSTVLRGLIERSTELTTGILAAEA